MRQASDEMNITGRSWTLAELIGHVVDGPDVNRPSPDAELIRTLRMEIDQQQRLRAMAITELLSLKRERDMLAIALGERASIDAEATVAAIMARADEDGAMHRDAMIEVLRTMGAR